MRPDQRSPKHGTRGIVRLVPNGQGSLEPAQPMVLECPPSRTLCLPVTRGTQAFHRAWPAVCCFCAQYRVRDTGNVINHRPMSFTFTRVACASCSRKGVQSRPVAKIINMIRKIRKLLNFGGITQQKNKCFCHPLSGYHAFRVSLPFYLSSCVANASWGSCNGITGTEMSWVR